MKADNMKSVATFTIFSFLLLLIAMFLVVYRYDLYNMDGGTSIRIGLVVHDARNGTTMGQDAKSREQKSQKDEMQDQYSLSENGQRDSATRKDLRHPTAGNTQFFHNIIAIMATESHQPGEAGSQKLPLGAVVTQSPPSDDPIRRMISKLGKMVPKQNVDLPITTVENIPSRPTLAADSVDRGTVRIPPTPKNPIRNGGSTTTSSVFKESEHNKHVVYPPETLPTPVPAASPAKSWPSMILPDSGFANSDEISPFSLFSRFADFMRSDEEDILKPSDYDSQEMWPRMDDLTEFFKNPGENLLQEYSSEELDNEESKEDSEGTEDSDGIEFQNPIYSFLHDVDRDWKI
ncbi:hypothetical protein GE061_015640 [Apolygus lucorum]|uniref:Uncharacterized protein n=1 Tax=Apolygus lucorum TaxID=248454 RepID=A0A8S9XPC4_APOLU|nr:hypothetical protein GE061_015640 [Apolygus lucorum]